MLASIFASPPASGPEAVRQIRAQRPDLPVLFVSGDTRDASLELQPGKTEFLGKPLVVAELCAKVLALLPADA